MGLWAQWAIMGSMSRSKHTASVNPNEKIEEIDVSAEMRGSFLEYAYSVIYTRALPDARDGLKPVQRRILFQMDKMGLRPDRGHVKSSRVVGDVMGKLHPHGDTAIYDALVRLAQPFNLRQPLVDGHGNFGSLDDGPAAARYTEARLDPAALLLTDQLDEDTVNFVPNYDNQFQQPEVLPAAFPNLLVNGASGIAVGMATNLPPHNPGEALMAAIHLLENPDADTDELMQFIPAPDFPGGGVISDLDAVRTAYETGRGSFRVRGQVSVERISARKTGLVVTELPYMVGPERVIERIKDAVSSGKLKGISAVTNLTDRHHGLRLVIDVKSGFNPQAVLEHLYRLTPLEESFPMNAVALVDGQPQTLSLRRMLQVFVEHRLTVTRRRTEFRLTQRLNRLHLVDGLLRAILNIDDVITIIRSSEDTAVAQQRLMTAFDLTETQADYILELRLRRLTKFSRLDLEQEQSSLNDEIAQLREILASDQNLSDAVAKDLRAAKDQLVSPRRTALLDGSTQAVTAKSAEASVPLEIADEPCLVILGANGTLLRVAGDEPPATEPQATDSLWRTYITSTTRSQVAVITDDGVAHRLDVVSLPPLMRTPGSLSLANGVPAKELITSERPIIGVIPLDVTVAVGTELGVVKRIRPEHPENKDSWTIINLEEGDRVVAADTSPDSADLVFITAGAQLLRTRADKVRPQGINAGGVAGIRLTLDDRVIAFGSFVANDEATVVTVAQEGGTLAGTAFTSWKSTPLEQFPYKGRATQGVRCQRLLRGEDSLALAWAGDHTPRAQTETGHPVDMPDSDERRDGSGSPIHAAVYSIG